MDDTLLLFRSTEHVEKSKKYLNKQRKYISFISGTKWLIVISRHQNKPVRVTSLLPEFTETLHLVDFLLILQVLFSNIINLV